MHPRHRKTGRRHRLQRIAAASPRVPNTKWDKDQWSLDDVFDLFNSGNYSRPRGFYEEYVDFQEFLNRGWILCSDITYVPTPEPELTEPRSAERGVFEAAFNSGSGGQAHSLLKWWAWNWLKSQGELAPAYERWVDHGRADLVAPNRQWLVECGDTSPEKVFTAFESNNWHRFALFPFVAPEEYVAVVFRPSVPGLLALAQHRERMERAVRELICSIVVWGVDSDRPPNPPELDA